MTETRTDCATDAQTNRSGGPAGPDRPEQSRGLIGLRGSEELLQCRDVQEVDPGHAVGQETGVGDQQVGRFTAGGERRTLRRFGASAQREFAPTWLAAMQASDHWTGPLTRTKMPA